MSQRNTANYTMSLTSALLSFAIGKTSNVFTFSGADAATQQTVQKLSVTVFLQRLVYEKARRF